MTDGLSEDLARRAAGTTVSGVAGGRAGDHADARQGVRLTRAGACEQWTLRQAWMHVHEAGLLSDWVGADSHGGRGGGAGVGGEDSAGGVRAGRRTGHCWCATQREAVRGRAVAPRTAAHGGGGLDSARLDSTRLDFTRPRRLNSGSHRVRLCTLQATHSAQTAGSRTQVRARRAPESE